MLIKGLAYLYIHSRKRHADILSLESLASFDRCQLFPLRLGTHLASYPPDSWMPGLSS